MSNRTHHLEYIPLEHRSPEGHIRRIAVYVSYPIPGSGWSKCYTLHMQPESLEVIDGTTFRRCFPREGYQVRLLQAHRFSAAKLGELAHAPETRANIERITAQILQDEETRNQGSAAWRALTYGGLK